MKRIFDVLFSLAVLLLLFPLLLVIGILIKLDSTGGIFYLQKRVGKNFREFSIIKFRTMRIGAEKGGLLTVGEKDNRVTRIGYYLRKYKLDELPQFLNVLQGDMSVVGPRPEVKKYVDLYTEEQKKVLTVKPGITDLASIKYSNENEVLLKYPDAEDAYVKEIMPRKLEMALEYVKHANIATDLRILFLTLQKIIFS